MGTSRGFRTRKHWEKMDLENTDVPKEERGKILA